MSFASTFRSAAKDFLRLTITTTPTAQTAWQTPEMPRSPCPQRSSPATGPANSAWGIRWAEGKAWQNSPRRLSAAACGCGKKNGGVERNASCSEVNRTRSWRNTVIMFRTVAREIFASRTRSGSYIAKPMIKYSPARQYVVIFNESDPTYSCSVLCHRCLVVIIRFRTKSAVPCSTSLFKRAVRYALLEPLVRADASWDG